MVFVKYPLDSLNTHTDFIAWKSKTTFNDGDWKDLRNYLHCHLESLKVDNNCCNPKCWYTEMNQLDIFAQDVEHFRPKNKATPIKNEQKNKIEKILGYEIPQLNDEYAYPWLEFNTQNYRPVTALPNRGGGKLTSFPILIGTKRLPKDSLPQDETEYSLLLDPCNIHDANLLSVDPTGNIYPKAAKTVFTKVQLDSPDIYWKDDMYNFLRAWVTIIVYRLDDGNLIRGRQIVFSNVIKYLSRLERCVRYNDTNGILDNCKDIKQAISSYSEFALAARCALLSYEGIETNNFDIVYKNKFIIKKIYKTIIDIEKNVK